MLKTFNMAIPSKAILAQTIPYIGAFTSLQWSLRRRSEVRRRRRRSEVGGQRWRRRSEVGGRRRRSEAEVGCGGIYNASSWQPCKFVEVGGRWKSVIHHTWKLCKTQHKLRKVSQRSTVKSSKTENQNYLINSLYPLTPYFPIFIYIYYLLIYLSNLFMN